MSGKVNLWLVALCAALIGVVVGMMMNGPVAVAQGDGDAQHIVALAGYADQSHNEQPIYVIDTREQTLLVYEYGLGQSGLNFIAARTIKYDKLVEEYDIRQNRGVSPSIDQIKKLKRKRRR